MKKLLLFSFTLLFSISIFAQAQKNLTLLGQLTFPNKGDLSNLWGYTAPDGTEYAIVGLEMGVSIVSLADPTNPVEVQFLPGVQTIWREVKTFSHYAYIVNEGGDGVRIVDLAGLPGSVVSKDTVLAGIVTGHTVSETDGFLYINGYNGNNGGFKIFDLNIDPWRPPLVGTYSTRYVHDCYVRGNTMYAGQINDGLLAIIDLTNKANPQDIATHSYINSFTHNAWLNDAGNVCFTTDEVNAAYIYAWDITDPSNIIELDKIRSSLSAGAAIPHNIHVKNDYGVTSYYRDGVLIFDVSHPNAMVEVGYYDTSPLSGGNFNGCWGVYPYFQSGHIIASDIENGLFVLNPTYVRGCFLEGIVTDAVTGSPISGATISMSTITDNSIATGAYTIGIADAGTFQVTYSKPGYVSQTISASLTNGVTVTQNIQLQPVQTFAIGLQVMETGTSNPISGAQIVMDGGGGLVYNLTTVNGTASTSAVGGTYTVTVGNWGYRTKQTTLNISAAGNQIIYLDKGYYDDFYFDFGWTVSSTCSAGDWEKGEPQGTAQQNGSPSNPDLDVANDIGDECYVTGNGGGSIGGDDVDGGSTELRSPIFDLTTYNNSAKIFYNWWFFNKDLANQGTINDHFKVSITNGTTTQQVRDYTGEHAVWALDSFVVSSVITPTATMQLILNVADAAPGHITEGAFDKFWVTGSINTSIDAAISAQTSFSVSPNPIANNFSVNYHFPAKEVATYSMEIYDVTGKMLKNYPLSTSEGTLSVSEDFPQGLYLIALKWNNMVVKSVKVVKE